MATIKYISYVIFLFISVTVVKSEYFNIAGLFEENENQLNPASFELAIRHANEKLESNHKINNITSGGLPTQEPFYAIKTICSLIENGIIGVFGPESLSNINAIQSVCDEKELPHILTRWIYYPLRPGTAINFYPYPPLLGKAYWDIIQSWRWKTFTVLYENDESLLRLSDLILTAKDNGVIVTVEQLDRDDTGHYRDALKRVWKTRQRYLVIDCHINILVSVLEQCQQLGLMTNDYSYFLTNLDAHTRELSPFQWSQTNITGIRIINPDSEYVQSIASILFPEFDAFQSGSKLESETALIYDAVQMFSEIIQKVALSDSVLSLDCYSTSSWELGYTLVNLLKTSSYKGLTGHIEFNNEGYRNVFGLQIYELREGGIVTVASYNSIQGLNVTRQYHHTKIDEKDSMRNKTFKVIISLTEPYGMLKETSENLVGNERYEGFSIDLIQELAILENFNYTFTVQHDGANGKKDPKTGKWSGMIGAVISGQCLNLIGERFRKIIPENFEWDKDQCPSLEEITIQAIAKHFQKKPLLNELPYHDRILLLDLLPLDLPLEFVIPLIDDEYYWERRYKYVFKYTWRKPPDNWTWKSQYLERHCQHLMENAEPQYGDEETFDIILDMCNKYVTRLFVEQLQVWKPPLTMDKEDIPEVWPTDHINFTPIFKRLTNLVEVDIVFGMKNVRENFKLEMFKVTKADCQKLGKALRELPNLKILRIHNSNLVFEHCQAIMQGLIKCPHLHELDLSHCQIADPGALCVAYYLETGIDLKILNLTNNGIKKIGAEGLGYAILQNGCKNLTELNLRLNPLGTEGVMGILRAIVRSSLPRTLSLAACMFDDDTPLKICQMIRLSDTLKKLDISSNYFGEEIGDFLVQSMEMNQTIEWLDARETDISPEQKEKIDFYLKRNRNLGLIIKYADVEIAQEEREQYNFNFKS